MNDIRQIEASGPKMLLFVSDFKSGRVLDGSMYSLLAAAFVDILGSFALGCVLLRKSLESY